MITTSHKNIFKKKISVMQCKDAGMALVLISGYNWLKVALKEHWEQLIQHGISGMEIHEKLNTKDTG